MSEQYPRARAVERSVESVLEAIREFGTALEEQNEPGLAEEFAGASAALLESIVEEIFVGRAAMARGSTLARIQALDAIALRSEEAAAELAPAGLRLRNELAALASAWRRLASG